MNELISPDTDLMKRAAQIRLLILDVDGVLTDGRLFFDDDGRESKAFHVRDGYGIKLVQERGIEVAVITARYSPAVAHRAHDLGIKRIFQGCSDKNLAYTELKIALGLDDAVVAYMGDDLLDLPILTRVGLATAPADAHPEVGCRVHWRSAQQGGYGAVRELCELILRAQGHWSAIIARAAGVLP
ncbi:MULTISPECIES: KdsC family phosphatase [Acidithiobacillus]|jgi:HAD-superfamily hydrolase, subfamily IIIA|uniref:3-deoxy-D-manno-octulosonate 8-phosphate phosphatase KdsC n=2 Tax=Acidithiobacillus TaxID=119977 RepID=A0A179B6Y1_ACIFR|nr:MULTISPECIES: phenylphosphate carboxylase subunit delta [Acidithiobacillus]MBU2830552.1 phenylphosphate carboxylase subunit delta [Acidithiobacillus ferriphilus]MBU2832091.1 phenylphosphate carboxylase subunit delta [Acidithiobacillus ferriphilus]MBU2848859.1 phenylphosphate carboxylase subunit delta [Acidithiobacillus ferriphilus]MBU2853648.1 phenylphosphate carboxylase subunit delta [Acidithiobacillus ferriphilus]MDA8154333.1 phenylphosphate carboxylase subunit delta [Acidithiobacillus sp